MSTLVRSERCSTCTSRCLGHQPDEVHCQNAISDYLITTCTVFGASRSTALGAAALFLRDQVVCPTDPPPERPRRPRRGKRVRAGAVALGEPQ